MIKSISILLLLLNHNIAGINNTNKGSLIIGSNSIQKILFSTSSNFGRNHRGIKAIDSDNNSAWISKDNGPHWIEIDFKIKRIMNKIIIYTGKMDNNNTIKKFSLQFIHNGKWFDFIKIKNFNLKNKYEIDLGGIDASKFRIFIPEDGTYSGQAAIAEIEAYIGSNKLKYFDERLIKMCIPIRNGLLPIKDYNYPNAPRKYRGGKHVGLDILHYFADETYEPIAVTEDTPILAAKNGVIIRADWNYRPLTTKEWLNQSAYYKKNPRTFVKRSFGGIQVWIDHEDGIVTTYNHLSKMKEHIKKGVRVKKGEQIGWAGNSGLMGEAEGKNYGIHLHFEIWVDGYFLGKGMRINDIKKYFSWIFSIH